MDSNNEGDSNYEINDWNEMMGSNPSPLSSNADDLIDRFRLLRVSSNHQISPLPLPPRNLGCFAPRNPIDPSPRSVLPSDGIAYQNPSLDFINSSIIDLNRSRSFSSIKSSQSFESLVVGSVYSLAKSFYGSSYLQRKLNEGRHCVDSIFDGVVGHVVELMKHVSGSLLVQKLFDQCSEAQIGTVLSVLGEGNSTIFRLSMNYHGTRSMQKLIENLKNHEQVAVVRTAVMLWLPDLINDMNGNQVIGHCVKHLSTEDTKFIFVAAANYCLHLATQQYGCRVLQCCIIHSPREYIATYIWTVISSALLLAQHASGNFVIQCVIGLRSTVVNARLASEFAGYYVQLSMQKTSSYVVSECFMKFGDYHKTVIVHELLSSTQFEQLLQHPYANYVIQSALDYTEGAPYAALVRAIIPHASYLRGNIHFKKIFKHLLSNGFIV